MIQEFPSVQLPEHWVWMNDWRIDQCETVDEDGWAYGHDYASLKNWPPPSAYDKASTTVRRRRWIRSRQCKDDIKHLYIPLGILEPHSSVPCPVGSLRSGVPDYIVQVKVVNPHFFLVVIGMGKTFYSRMFLSIMHLYIRISLSRLNKYGERN
jgi:hypothetical protein